MSTEPKSMAATIMFWVGWLLTVLSGLALCASAYFKVSNHEMVTKGFPELGYDVKLAFAIGVVELVCALLYLIPQTAVLGAILVTGYLGGAVATHVRLDQPFTSPIIIGALVWGGLFLRDSRIRALVPFRRV
jgi:hypothetical protein